MKSFKTNTGRARLKIGGNSWAYMYVKTRFRRALPVHNAIRDQRKLEYLSLLPYKCVLSFEEPYFVFKELHVTSIDSPLYIK